MRRTKATRRPQSQVLTQTLLPYFATRHVALRGRPRIADEIDAKTYSSISQTRRLKTPLQYIPPRHSPHPRSHLTLSSHHATIAPPTAVASRPSPSPSPSASERSRRRAEPSFALMKWLFTKADISTWRERRERPSTLRAPREGERTDNSERRKKEAPCNLSAAATLLDERGRQIRLFLSYSSSVLHPRTTPSFTPCQREEWKRKNERVPRPIQLMQAIPPISFPTVSRMSNATKPMMYYLAMLETNPGLHRRSSNFW